MAALKSGDEKSPTYGELIAQAKLPGGDAPPAAVAKVEPPKAEPPKTEPAKPEPPKTEPAKSEPPKTPAPPATPPPPPVVKHVPTPAELDAIAKITALGGSVRDIAMNDDSKDVDFHLGGTALKDDGLVLLKAIPNIVSLSLKDTQITDADSPIWKA